MARDCHQFYSLVTVVLSVQYEKLSLKSSEIYLGGSFFYGIGKVMDFTVPCDDMPRVVFYVTRWGDMLCVIYVL